MTSSFLALVFGYLCGSIPFGLIVTHLAGVTDPRGIGSKNIGATNVLRTGRKDLAALTLLADVLKGSAAVLVATHFDGGSNPVPLGISAAAGAFFGHLFPLFLGFKGGKGVATFFGCVVALVWPAALAFAVVWLGVALLTRYSSAAALCATLITPVVVTLLGHPETAILFTVLAAAVWVKHRANIKRLLAGSESKIGQKAGT